MAHNGKLFLDFTAPPKNPNGDHWPDSDLKKMHDAVEADINVKDPFKNGYCVRNNWLILFDVPSIHSSMLYYCSTKLADLSIGAKAVEDPPQPIAYCYSGDTRICYHPHIIELNDAPWTVPVPGLQDDKGNPVLIYMVIVLTYETVCFS